MRWTSGRSSLRWRFAAATALSLGIYRHFENRMPIFNRIIGVIGTALFVFFAVWAALEAPGLFWQPSERSWR